MGRKTHGPYLIAAIEHNDLKKVNEILAVQIRSKAKVQEFLISDVRRLASEYAEVPLLLAACNEDPTIVKLFVTKFGADINHVHEEGFSRKKKRKTALIEAVRRGLYPTVEAILALNANSNIQDHKGRTALHHAVRKADYRMAKILCSRGAQVNVADKANNSPLHIATIFGHLELVKVLVKYGGDLYKGGQHGAIPIHIAAREGHPSIVRLFCQFEVNVNTKVPCYDGKEKAPIHVAAEEGHAETVFAMLDTCSADVGLRDSEGETPLHCTAINEYDPMGMKAKEDYTETVKVLLNFGADVNIQNRRGETPLHLAARNEFQKSVEVLVQAGSDPLIEDYDHNKAIDLVFPEDTVSKQLLKNAQEEREKFMSDAIELRARGFTTAIPKPLPLSMRSQSTMSIGVPGALGSYGRAASVPTLLMPQHVPPAVYEDAYLQPVDPRHYSDSTRGPSVSQDISYKSSQSRSTGSSSGSRVIHPPGMHTYADIEEGSTQSGRPSRRRGRRIGSESNAPNPKPLMNHRRAQSADRLNEPDSPSSRRALPSPPQGRRGQSQPRFPAHDQNPARISEDTSIWDVTPHTSISTYQDLNDQELARNGPSSLPQRLQNQPPAQPQKVATIAKRQPSPIRFLPAGPHVAEQSQDEATEDDDSYFDDESFDTLDTLSADEVETQPPPPQPKKHTSAEMAKKSGSQGSLHEWLEEQAVYIRERDEKNRSKPVAQSTPPRQRSAQKKPVANYDTADTGSEFSEPPPRMQHRKAPVLPPKPLPRERHPPPPVPSAKPALAPKPKMKKPDTDVQNVIELAVDTSKDPGQTIIRVLPVGSEKEQPVAPPRPPRQQPPPVPEQNNVEAVEQPKKEKTKKKGKKKKKTKKHIEENNNDDVVQNSVTEQEVHDVEPQKPASNALKWLPAGSADITYDSIKHSDHSGETEDANLSSYSLDQQTGTETPVTTQSPVSNKQPKAKKKKKGKSNVRQQMFQEDLAKEEEQREIERREQEMIRKQEQEQQLLAEKQKAQQRQVQIQQQRQQQYQESDESLESEKSPRRKVTIANQDVGPKKEELTRSASDARTVVFNTEGELKFRLVGGNVDGIFVSQVDPMSDAKGRGLQDGDQIIRINGRGIKHRTKEEVHQAISSSGSQVALMVKYQKAAFDEVMAHGGIGDKFYVKALYSHDPDKPGELTVREDDIFEVKDSLPEGAFGSWMALKISGKTTEEDSSWKPLKASKKEENEQPGFIPNKARGEQLIIRERLSLNKSTNRGGLFTRSFGRSKSADRFNKARDAEKRAAAEGSAQPYERVEKATNKLKRPVILLGLFCDAVRQQILYDDPDSFVSPETEVEVPTANGPVDVRPIKRAMEKHKHCMAIVSPKAIEYLIQHTDLNPMVIYMSPNNKNVIKVVKSKLAPDYDRKVNYMFDEAVKFEKQYAHLFTTTVPYTADDSWLPALKDQIRETQNLPFWRPASMPEPESDDDLESPALRLLGNRGAQRMSRTTDDIPDPIQSVIDRHATAARGRLHTIEGNEYGDMASEDYTSDDSENEVDVGVRRPMAQHGGMPPNMQQRQQQAQPHQYATPIPKSMRNRNRSEGDILQYMNNEPQGMPPGQYANTGGRHSGDFNHFQPPHPGAMQYRPPPPRGRMGPDYEYMGGRHPGPHHPAQRMQHPGQRMQHPGQRMQHPGQRMQHPGQRMPHPAQRMQHPQQPPQFAQPPMMQRRPQFSNETQL